MPSLNDSDGSTSTGSTGEKKDQSPIDIKETSTEPSTCQNDKEDQWEKN